MHLKGLSILKKGQKPRRNRPTNGNAMHVRTAPLERTARRPRSVTKNIQTQCFRTYSRRALYDLPHTLLHGDRARRAYQKRCHLFFDPTHSFSYRVHGKIRPN